MLRITTALALVIAAPALAEERRELSAHVHGHSTLNIAIEAGQVAMELEAPGADIVGFEHAAESDEDKAAIEDALAVLREPLTLFVPPAEAGCTVASADVKLLVEGGDHDEHEHGEHGHGDEEHAEAKAHGEHDHDHGDEEHAEAEAHGEHAHDDHAHGEEHGEHAEHQEGHTEFRAEYRIACADPSKLTAFDFAFFDKFAGAEEVDVQLVTESGSTGFEVERDAPRIEFGGAS